MTAKPSEYFIPNVGIVQVGAAFRLPDGRRCNNAWLGGASEDDLTAIGAVPVVRAARPAYNSDTQALQEVQNEGAITYQVIDKQPAEIDAAISDRAREAVKAVDDFAEQVRLRFLTAGSGQAMVYQEKVEVAAEWVAAGSPADASAFSLISAEIGITAEDAAGVVAVWQTMRAAWRQVAATIEAIRLGTKAAIDAAAGLQDFAGIETAKAVALETLDAIEP